MTGQKLIYTGLTVLILGLLFSCASKKVSRLTKKYPPPQLKEDALLFRDITLAMHPVIGIYKPRQNYMAGFESLINSLNDSLTEKQFRIKLKLLIDGLHCGHTEAMASLASVKEIRNLKLNYSPYLFMPLQDTLYMVAALNKKSDTLIKKGSIILSINGVGTDSILRYCKRFISSDGYNQTAKNHFIQWNFNNYYLALFGRPDTFKVKVCEKGGVKTVNFAAIKLKTIPPVSFAPKSDSNLVVYRRAHIKYKYLDTEKKNLYLKVERFSNRKFRKAYRKIFRQLKHNESSNLVLDLRSNGGGSIANAYWLLSYLMDTSAAQTFVTSHRRYPYGKYTRGNVWFKFTRGVMSLLGKHSRKNDTDFYVMKIKPFKKNHFNGKVYVLINGGSFSASALVSAYLKHRNRALFIGTETGGAQEGCNAGITPYYTLPNTKVRIRMPAFRVKQDVYEYNTGHGIMPDVPVHYNINSVLGRRDLELQKVKSLMRAN